MRREQAIVDEVSSHTSSRNPSFLNTISNHIDQFIIIDRNIDIVTPLCTQLTYEGLIDETMGIQHCKSLWSVSVPSYLYDLPVLFAGFVDLDASLVNPGQPSGPAGARSPGQAGAAAAAGGSSSSTQPAKKKKYVLNASDKLFSQLRDQNFAVVAGMLNKIAKRINENYEVRARISLCDISCIF